ncbi:hypothetical protein M2404_004030 [Rheinheimera pacifica]|uniref:hypothetical protein n=1 Tax=Rheinheimera pacifica TaxID=173990 RepID=UPI00216A82D5|nr:hypothetical protein [Rheinheimera pacifica]MCS4309653.1 hypothetical protein [Rheinheimera pacifica]
MTIKIKNISDCRVENDFFNLHEKAADKLNDSMSLMHISESGVDLGGGDLFKKDIANFIDDLNGVFYIFFFDRVFQVNSKLVKYIGLWGRKNWPLLKSINKDKSSEWSSDFLSGTKFMGIAELPRTEIGSVLESWRDNTSAFIIFSAESFNHLVEVTDRNKHRFLRDEEFFDYASDLVDVFNVFCREGGMILRPDVLNSALDIFYDSRVIDCGNVSKVFLK